MGCSRHGGVTFASGSWLPVSWYPQSLQPGPLRSLTGCSCSPALGNRQPAVLWSPLSWFESRCRNVITYLRCATCVRYLRVGPLPALADLASLVNARRPGQGIARQISAGAHSIAPVRSLTCASGLRQREAVSNNETRG